MAFPQRELATPTPFHVKQLGSKAYYAPKIALTNLLDTNVDPGAT